MSVPNHSLIWSRITCPSWNNCLQFAKYAHAILKYESRLPVLFLSTTDWTSTVQCFLENMAHYMGICPTPILTISCIGNRNSFKGQPDDIHVYRCLPLPQVIYLSVIVKYFARLQNYTNLWKEFLMKDLPDLSIQIHMPFIGEEFKTRGLFVKTFSKVNMN